MCGIAGCIHPNPEVRRAATTRMLSSLAHRGPDSTAVVHEELMSLGVTQLRIIDQAGASQCFSSEDEQVTAVANCEIYNAPELRARLERSGRRFTSGNDAEVLPHLYQEL